MSHATVFPPAPNARQRLRLGFCLALVALPHVFHLPLWVVVLAAVLFAWQIRAAWYDHALPGRSVRFVLAAAAFGAVLAGFGRVNGQQAGVSLLVLMLVLKLCEIRSHRDVSVFLSLTCFLLITQFLFSQSLTMAAYLVVGIWLITAAFVDSSGAAELRPALAGSARLLGQALPVAALLFVLFPRVPGPLWGLPADAGATANNGLSEQMSPGSIASLALSDAVAFRARFANRAPPPVKRYWRGPVLWDFARGTWRAGDADHSLPAATVTVSARNIQRTQITLEPTRHDWLIALDLPLDANRPARQGASATLTLADDIDHRTRYTVRSALAYRLDARLDPATRARATELPDSGNPRARALAARWRARDATPASTVTAALQMFHDQSFIYTLSPQRTSRENSVDDFLFNTREGFCEHYAGAFTFLMRAAGIPARVVTGYQGGEPALVGDYWVVRNSDAHAWSEVWLADRGWTRIDPTAAVAPERIESGIAAALPDSAALPYMARAGGSAWYRTQMLWDGVNATWDRWFLAYGPRLQQRVFGVLGLKGWGPALIALTVGVVGALSVISLWLGWQMRCVRQSDRVARAWQRLCERLAAAGYPRARHEGPHSYGERVAGARADLAAELRALVDLYIHLRYAPAQDAGSESAFIERAAAFKPRRQRH